jgi:membrane fusion protein (multidrug efflux system)
MAKRFSNKNLIRISAAIIVAFVIIYCSMRYFDRHPNTDNAYIQANVVNIAAQVTGPVLAIQVKDHQKVAKGDVLFSIDSRPYLAALKQAEATVAMQKANLLYADQNAKRVLRLVSQGQQSQAAGDAATANLDTAKANVDASVAQAENAKLNVSYTEITAPNDGVVSEFLLRPGNNVIANTVLFQIVEQAHFWVDANFKETQIARIKPGQKASIKLDMYPDQTLKGTVDAVSSASGSVFSLLPPENASGNWVKVTQRFPVKIWVDIDDHTPPLRAGASADVTIDTTS